MQGRQHQGAAGPIRMIRCLATAAMAAAVAAVTVGCASSQRPPAPVKVDVPVPGYTIGPLDTLTVVVWRNPDLSTTVEVRPDGKVSTPLVSEVQAAGRHPADLAKDIETVLSKYIREPVVSVAVSEFQGVYADQIRIVGEAAKTQAVPYRQNMTVLDVMIQVGGMTDFADGNRAVLVRGAEGGKEYGLRLDDLLKRGDISANVAMMPGDIIIVPQSWF